MNWTYKFAYEGLDEMMANRPWLLVDDDFSSADPDEFLHMQKDLFLQRGWDWFKRTLRGRLFHRLKLTTLTTVDREQDPSQGDPDPQQIAKVQEEFPGVSVVSLVGIPHVVAGPPVADIVLREVKRYASDLRWKRGLDKIAYSYKYTTDFGRLRQLLSDSWKIVGGGAAGGVLAWLLSLGISPVQLDQQLRSGASPQEVIAPFSPEEIPPELSSVLEYGSPEVTQMPRGIRNNNPGNLERNEIDWQGMADDQTDERFITFVTPDYGIRAMARVLRNYERRHGLNTIEQIVSRWAPASENQTSSYIQHVADELSVSPTASLNLDDDILLGRLISAIIEHENGMNPYGNEVISQGVLLERR